MSDWQAYTARPGSTVTGTLLEYPGVGDTQHPPRTPLAWLPPSYASSAKRYPVVYFHDGQNVFDDATAFSGEWHADEILTDLAAQGIEAIAIGIPNADELRFHEYSLAPNPEVPFPGGGGAGDYVAFLANTVKPLVDGSLRTLPDPVHTTVIGSSMGGVVSLHALLARPDVFGNAGVMSPAFWTNNGLSLEEARRSPTPAGRIWLDVGGKESDDPERASAYWQDAAQMAQVLGGMGQRLRFVSDPKAIHHEAAWAARLPEALRFLLGAG